MLAILNWQTIAWQGLYELMHSKSPSGRVVIQPMGAVSVAEKFVKRCPLLWFLTARQQSIMGGDCSQDNTAF